MYELLQKLGVPAGLAGLIGALVVMVPFIFKIDERYAKADQFQEEIKALEQENQKLRIELAQLAGFQQTMILFMQQNNILRPIRETAPNTTSRPSAPVAIAPTPSVRPAPAPAPAPAPEPAPVPVAPKVDESPIERPRNWKELNEGLLRQQERLTIPRDIQKN